MGDSAVHKPGEIERYGVVAVVKRDRRLLVIRRAPQVIAPLRVCFPGGGIEPGETEAEALIREVDEELGVEARPVRRLWQSVTRRRHSLSWWLVHLDSSTALKPNPAEVESAFWTPAEELLAMPDLLEGNQDFVAAVARGEVDLTYDRLKSET